MSDANTPRSPVAKPDDIDIEKSSKKPIAAKHSDDEVKTSDETPVVEKQSDVDDKKSDETPTTIDEMKDIAQKKIKAEVEKQIIINAKGGKER
jgi:hypothetical protein